MTNEQRMLRELDQLTDLEMRRQDPATGRFLVTDYHTDTRGMGFTLAHQLLCLIHPMSRHSGSAALAEAIRKGLDWEKANRNASGCFDLSSCNFDSAPDTAFTANALYDAWVLLKDSGSPWREEFLPRVAELIERACEGICAGGFHTPNHRWAIAACLKQGTEVTGRQEFSRRADVYLGEGLDIDDEGEFAERSTGTYNAVNDDQMLRLYLTTGDERYLKAARSNLKLMLRYIDPDGTVFTLNSTRQDRGQKVYPAGYYGLYLLAGWLSRDPEMAAWGQMIWESCEAAGTVPQCLPWLMRFPQLESYGKQVVPPMEALRRYSKVWPASRIGRWRRGDLTVTAMAGTPRFLAVTHRDMTALIALYGNVCDKRYFLAERVEETPEGFRLTSRFPSWYYLPFEGDQPPTTDWWAMDNAATRKRQIREELTVTVEGRVTEDGLELALRAEGMARVPLRMEAAFTPGSLRTDQLLMEANAGQGLTLMKGCAEMTGREGGCLRLEEGFAEHNNQRRMTGAMAQDPDRFTVYLTCYTPAEKKLRILAGSRYSPAL